MRVTFVSTLDAGLGPVSHVLQIAPHVAAAGVVTRLVCQNEQVAELGRQVGLDTHVVTVNDKWDVGGVRRLHGCLRGSDVVHTHDRRAGLWGRIVGRATGAKVVHTFHGLQPEIHAEVGREQPPLLPDAVPEWKLTLLRKGYIGGIERALAYLGHVIVPSQALATYLIRHGLPRSRVTVLPYGIDIRRRHPGPPSTPPVIMTAAVLEWWKGVDVLLEAFAMMTTPARLDIYGQGTRRTELEQKAARLGVGAHFHGSVLDIRERMERADVFVLPSRAENLPVAILEAMAAALPVVATRVGGIAEEIDDGATGFVVDPDDAPALAAALDRLAANPSLRHAFGEAAARRAASHFEAGMLAGRMVDLYKRLCASSR